ncbi:DUF4013 domain-containing protein [Methanomicrobium antiquum]|uniref:DUF4013 domain-containing protein n=1 Tax=Methanomicrobium antiquum TaxID=487686 RepID=A0AAF0JUA5_9EURY|nr:DUF4013 domain-containing protein [Methanomicrobium antiquum]WFN37528.1 DUF4013 domain-containing protein [Methanomicrobium antiquum]
MSDYYAFSSIDPAIERTKRLLWPFNKGIWLRIALISLFIGGFTSFNPFQFTSGTDSTEMPSSFAGSDLFMDQLPVILGVVAVIIILALIFGYISCVFQYLFVECLSKNEFAIRKYFKTNTKRGARLFGFELVIGGLLIAVIMIAVFMMIMGFASVSIDSMQKVGFFISIFLLVLLLSIPIGIIMLFTVDFVVPIMIKENCKLIEGWKKCWGVIKTDWSQTIIYLIMRIIIGIVVFILMFIAIMIAALVLAIPFFIVGLIAVGLNPGSFAIAFIILLILFILCMIPISLLISVPFITFGRYYSLNVLGLLDNNYTMLE